MFSLRAAVISYQLIRAEISQLFLGVFYLWYFLLLFFFSFVCGWHFPPSKKKKFSSSFEVERRLGWPSSIFASVGGHTPKLIGGSGVDGDWLPLCSPFYFVLPVPTHFWNESKSATVGRRREKNILCWRTHYVIEIDPSSSFFLGGI